MRRKEEGERKFSWAPQRDDSVLDFDQIETFGGSGGTCGTAVAGLHYGQDIGRADASLSNEEEGSDEVADQVGEEAPAADAVDKLFGMACEALFVDGADVGDVLELGAGICGVGLSAAQGAVGIDGGKGGKVVFAGDERSSLLHGRLIQGIGVVGDVSR